MTTQGLLSGKTVWIVFAAYFLFLIAIARYTTWKEKRDAGKVDLQGLHICPGFSQLHY